MASINQNLPNLIEHMLMLQLNEYVAEELVTTVPSMDTVNGEPII